MHDIIIHSQAIDQSSIASRASPIFCDVGQFILDSSLLWLFSWFIKLFFRCQFCQFQTHNKWYGKVVGGIWNIMTVFSTSFV